MSNPMVGAIHITLEERVATDEILAVADAIAMLRPVIEIDTLGPDLQVQIVRAHAKFCVRLDWPQVASGRAAAVCRGVSRSMLVTLDSTYYEHGARPIVAAIQRVRGVAEVAPIYVEDDHADSVKAEMARVKSEVAARIT
jgi:hypothetical protein